MPLFQNIGKALTNFGQDVANQSKNMSDNAKLKAAIGAEQKKVDDLYRLLGKAYVERAALAKASPESPLATQSAAELFAGDTATIEQINAALSRIQELQAALEAEPKNT